MIMRVMVAVSEGPTGRRPSQFTDVPRLSRMLKISLFVQANLLAWGTNQGLMGN